MRERYSYESEQFLLFPMVCCSTDLAIQLEHGSWLSSRRCLMKNQGWKYAPDEGCLILGLSLLLASPCSISLAAQPITPSGLNTQVTLSVTPPAGKTQYDITGGTRPGGG